MFTQDFRKLRLTVSSLIIIALIYSVVSGGLSIVSYWAETYKNAYPYKSEDWLRYLLPNRFKHRGRDWIMLTGPSAVRENLLYDRFNQAFPDMDTYQEALSLGTIDDLLISLKYIEKAYGSDVLPKVLVLGVTSRFIANIPEERPFINAINNYSPYYRVERISNKWQLVPKKRWEGILSRIHFIMFKQQGRYRTAVAAALSMFIDKDSIYGEEQKEVMHMSGLSHFLDDKVFKRIKRFVYFGISPYKYQNLQPLTHSQIMNWLLDPNSWWKDVHSWNPEVDISSIIRNLDELEDFTAQYGIRMYAVNLPENIASRRLYDPVHYRIYLEIIQRSLKETPFLNLHEFLDRNEFYDIFHARVPGAIRITDRVIEFISNDKLKPIVNSKNGTNDEALKRTN